jgi:GTP-binding protein
VQSIRRADLCLLVVDCAEGAKAQDRKIAELIVGEQKPCILVLNKFDLYHPSAKLSDRLEELHETMGREFFFMRYAPQIAVSATRKQFLEKIFSAVEQVRAGAFDLPGTGQLNRLLHKAEASSPATLGRSGKSFHLLYAALLKDDEPQAIPVPHVLLFANRAGKLQESYLRHLEHVIREQWPAEGLPMRFTVKGKERRSRDGDAEDKKMGDAETRRRGDMEMAPVLPKAESVAAKKPKGRQREPVKGTKRKKAPLKRTPRDRNRWR